MSVQFGTEEWLNSLSEVIHSSDLTEATYNISQDIMEDHLDFLAEVFQDNPVWEVYQDLFRITVRELDLSTLQEQGFQAPDKIYTEQGSFMGDTLSFMHLTLLLSTIANLASCENEKHLHKVVVERPFGQSVGDDLVFFNAKPWQARKLKRTFEEYGLPLSKVDSTFISGVFAENYFYKLVDKRELDKVPKEALFGDLWFVDSIKVMLLTGKPKVSSEKNNSFIGQANALNKQLAYLPPEQDWKRLRCRVYLWVNNYGEAVKLGRAKPHLPPELGGIYVPIGACDGPDSPLMGEKYLPYIYSMLKMEQQEFLAYQLILRGIFKSTRKGVPWSNDPEKILSICSIAAIVHRDDVEKEIRDLDFYTRLGQVERLRYLAKKKGWISAQQIDEELSRRETFLEFWYSPEQKRDFKTLKTQDAPTRHEQAWTFIRENVQPGRPEYYHRGRDLFEVLAKEFQMRLWGFFVNREDPAIRYIFDFTTSMHVDFSDRE